MNRKYNSTSFLIRSPKLRFKSTPKRLSDVTNSKLGNGCMDNHEVHIAQILCNVEDVFKKSPVNNSKHILDLSRSTSPCFLSNSYHRSHDGTYEEDLNESITSKIPSIANKIHELTLGPNAIVHDDMKNDTVISHSAFENVKTKPLCQDPKVSSEDSSLDENIRIYLKHECLETPRSDIPQHILEATNKFNHQQKREYLDSRKSIEQTIISEQLRTQSQFSPEAQVSCDTLSILERNKTAREGILNTLNELKMSMFKKKEKELEEHNKTQKEKQEQLTAICKVVTESLSRFRAKEEIFLNSLKCCSDIAKFQREGQELINFNSKVCTELNMLVNKCSQASISRDDVERLSKLMSRSQECFDQLGQIHENIEAQAAAALAKPAAQAVHNSSVEIINVEDSVEIIELEDSKNEESDNDTLNTIIDPSSLEFYKKTSGFYQSVESQLNSLVQDASLKSYRFQCMKAFNIPINAISGLDGKHTLDQYNRLVSVLRGDKTLGSGSSRVSQHPLGVLFCKYSMAKKFVAQVDVKPRVLFAYASVIVELWREFPDFGHLLLGEFHRKCPYLIPVFWPQLKGQSNEDYYNSLGYEYSDGQVEKQDLFLKRMTAMTQLYAAITVSPPRPTGTQPHPHNLQFSWRWLAAMLNLEPQPDVSATLLYSYLKIAGNKMAAVYKTQFFKLIHFIQVHYLRKIKQVTPEDQSQQSIAILEEFINKTVKTKHVPPPEGHLPPKFW